LLALVALLGVAALAGTASAEPNSSCGEGCATSSCAQRCDRAWIGCIARKDRVLRRLGVDRFPRYVESEYQQCHDRWGQCLENCAAT
jgi:hypothetical protein